MVPKDDLKIDFVAHELTLTNLLANHQKRLGVPMKLSKFTTLLDQAQSDLPPC